MIDISKISDWIVQEEAKYREAFDAFKISGWMKYELFEGPFPDPRKLIQFGFSENIVTQTGDQFYGDRAAQILGSTVAISAITSGTTSTVTSAAHGFTVGDRVIIAGVTPAGYNGSWVVASVPSATTFTIYVGTALGAGSAFGTAQGLSLGMATGMRLGTGTTAPAKTGAGAAIVTVATGANVTKALDATFPNSSLDGSNRRQIQYKVTWATTDAPVAALAEVVLTNESPISQVAGTAANTISRVLLSPTVDKSGSNATLAVTWNHALLGA